MQIYLSGAMQDASIEKQTKNRKYIKETFKDYSNVEVFNPYEYFNYQNRFHQSEKEVMNFELRNTRNSSLLIYEEQGIKSIGSSMEIAVAYENNIPILILNENCLVLHPWINEMSDRVFTDINDMIDYIKWYYLN